MYNVYDLFVLFFEELDKKFPIFPSSKDDIIESSLHNT
jgi:hypothetical protein